MKTTIETLTFPCEIKQKLKMKASFGNLNIKFINGHIIKIDKTNLSIQEPHKIIITNKQNILVAYIYNDSNEIYLPNHNIIISFTKYTEIINAINKGNT